MDTKKERENFFSFEFQRIYVSPTGLRPQPGKTLDDVFQKGYHGTNRSYTNAML
jgi:hypothetical protein